MNSCNFLVHKDDWLTRQIRTDAFCIKAKTTAVNYNRHKELNMVLKYSPVFVYTKVPVSNTQTVAMLESMKFKVIDTNITLQKRIERKKKLTKVGNFRLAQTSDEKEVVAIARKNFSFSRFHLDSAFSRIKANALKAAWAKSYFSGRRGNAMVVAQYEGRVAGFLQLLINEPQKTLTIDLIAVDKPFQGKGIASSMITFAENNFTNLNEIKVGTQIANIPSLKLYESLYFKINSASYVLHYHN